MFPRAGHANVSRVMTQRNSREMLSTNANQEKSNFLAGNLFPAKFPQRKAEPGGKERQSFLFPRNDTKNLPARNSTNEGRGGGKRRTKSVSVQKLGRGPPLKLQFPHHHLSPPPHREKSYITFNFSAKVSRLMTQRRCSLRGKISRSTNKDRCFD